MILIHELSIGAFHFGIAGRLGNTQYLIGICQFLARRDTSAASLSHTQHGLQLSNLRLGQAQPASDTQQHLMLCRMHLAICSDRTDLHLQKHTQQCWVPPANLTKLAQFGIKVELTLLAAIEGLDGRLTLVGIHAQLPEHGLCSVDLILRNNTVCFAQRAHYRKHGVQVRRLYLHQFGPGTLLQPGTHQQCDDSTKYKTCRATEQQAHKSTYQHAGQHGLSTLFSCARRSSSQSRPTGANPLSTRPLTTSKRSPFCPSNENGTPDACAISALHFMCHRSP